MERGFFLNVVIAEGATILELFARKDESLLIGGDSLLVLDLCLDIVNGVGWFDIEGDGLAREGFDKYLHDDDYGVYVGVLLPKLLLNLSIRAMTTYTEHTRQYRFARSRRSIMGGSKN